MLEKYNWEGCLEHLTCFFCPKTNVFWAKMTKVMTKDYIHAWKNCYLSSRVATGKGNLREERRECSDVFCSKGITWEAWRSEKASKHRLKGSHGESEGIHQEFKSISWPCTQTPENHTKFLRPLFKSFLKSVRLVPWPLCVSLISQGLSCRASPLLKRSAAPPSLVLEANLPSYFFKSCVQVVNEVVEKSWAKDGALQNPTSVWLPIWCHSIHHSPLCLTCEPAAPTPCSLVIQFVLGIFSRRILWETV